MIKIVTPEEAKRAREEALASKLHDLLVKLNQLAIKSGGEVFKYYPKGDELQFFDSIQNTFAKSDWSVQHTSSDSRYNEVDYTWTFRPRTSIRASYLSHQIEFG